MLDLGDIIRPNFFVNAPDPTASNRGRLAGRFQVERPAPRRRPWLSVCSLFASLLASAVSTQAQEALNSAISLDEILRKQNSTASELPPESPHLGPVQYNASAYAGIQLDDNIFLSQQNPQSDTIISAGLNLGLSWPATEQSTVNFSSQVGYATYLRFPSDNYLEVAPGSALTWTFSWSGVSLTFYDQLSAAEETLPVASVSNAGRIPRVDNTSGLRLTWQPGPWQVEAGYSHDIFFSSSSTYSYLNRNSEYYYARGAWLYATGSQLGLETSVSTTDYDLASQSGNTSYSLGPYLQWSITQYISATVRGGPTIYSFASTSTGTAASRLTSYYVELDLSHQWTKFLSQQLSVQRSVSPGYNAGLNYTEQYTANYYISWAATDWLSVNLGLTYENGQQPLEQSFDGFLFMSTESYNRYGLSPGLRYQLTQNSSLSLNFAYWKRRSNVPGNSYSEGSVSLQAQYSF
jgi:hypothetical protein